jgi:hypothetical protein
VDLARAQIDVEVVRQRAAKRLAAEAEGRQLPGRRPKPDSSRSCVRELPDAEARLQAAKIAVAKATRTAKVNVSDPQSRVMKGPTRFLQGYNAQGAVNQHQIVLASQVTQEGNDLRQFLPMVAATRRSARAAGINDPIGQALADSGYWSEANIRAPGPDRLIAPKDHYKELAAREKGICVAPPVPDASLVEAMEHRLRTAEGAAVYAIRSQTVEPAFGTIKGALGFRRFSCRGLAAADSEWSLVCAVHNLLKVFRHRRRADLARLVSVTV